MSECNDIEVINHPTKGPRCECRDVAHVDNFRFLKSCKRLLPDCDNVGINADERRCECNDAGRVMINGVCNQAEKGCILGTLNDEVYPDSSKWSSPRYDRWRCDGQNGGNNSGLCIAYTKLTSKNGRPKYQFNDFNVIYAEKFKARPVEGTNHSATWVRNLVSNPDENIYVTYSVINLTTDSRTFVESYAGGTEDRTYLASPSWRLKQYMKVKGSKGSRSFFSDGVSYYRNKTGLRAKEINYWPINLLTEGNLTYSFIKVKNNEGVIGGIVHKRKYEVNGNGGINGNQFLFFDSRSDEVRPLDSPLRVFYEMSRHDEITKLIPKDPGLFWVPFTHEMIPETFFKAGEEPPELFGIRRWGHDPTEGRPEIKLISVRKYE